MENDGVVKNPKMKIRKEKVIIFSIIFCLLMIVIAIFIIVYSRTNLVKLATYEGGEVTGEEYTVYYKMFAPLLAYWQYPAEIIPSQIANKAALDEILLKEAKKLNLKITAEDKAKVDATFKDENQVASLKKSGVDLEKARKLYYNDYVITYYIDTLKEKFSDEELLTHLQTKYKDEDHNEYVTRHILFKTIDDMGTKFKDDKLQEVIAKANNALVRINAGEDFATVAKEVSEDTGSKENGGKHIMYDDGITVKQYVDTVKNLEVGKYTTSLVETSYGYHIIYLEAKNENGRINSEVIKDELADKKIQELSTAYNLYLDNNRLITFTEELTGQNIDVYGE